MWCYRKTRMKGKSEGKWVCVTQGCPVAWSPPAESARWAAESHPEVGLGPGQRRRDSGRRGHWPVIAPLPEHGRCSRSGHRSVSAHVQRLDFSFRD